MTSPANRDELLELMARAMCVQAGGDPDGFVIVRPVDGKSYQAEQWEDFVDDAVGLLLEMERAGCWVAPEEPTDEWAREFCARVNWMPEGTENKFVEGRLHTVTFLELAKGYIRAVRLASPYAVKK